MVTHYICPLCNRGYLRRSDLLIIHLPTHTKEKPYVCPICDKSLARLGGLQLHMNNHVKPEIKCGFCSRVFLSKKKFEIHEQTHLPKKKLKLKCTSCKRSYTNSVSLKDHIARMHSAYSTRPFGCDLCPKRYMRHDKYMMHLSTHTGEKPFKCETCGKSFTLKRVLIAHKRSHQPPKFKCELCPKMFMTAGSLRYHSVISGMHTKSKKTQFCPTCNKAFRFPDQVKSHQLVHTDEKPFQCHICFVRRKTKGSLTHHFKAAHLKKEKRFRCTNCPKAFTSRTQLHVHIRCHTGERPFQCLFCPLQVSQSGTLLRHIQNHTQEKPFFCEMCEECFKDKSSLEDHFRLKHTMEKPFQCGDCSKWFSTKRFLLCHRRKECLSSFR